MKTDPSQEAALIINSTGIGTVTRKMVRERATELALRDRAPVRQEMKVSAEQSGAPGSHVYSVVVSANRPATDYTVRLIPHCDGVAVPLETSQILWQR